MTGIEEDPRRRVERAAAAVGIHAGLFQVRAGSVVRAMLEDELGPDAPACADTVDLLIAVVDSRLATAVTTDPVTPVAFGSYVARLVGATSMSPDDARWALATWAGVAAGTGPDPALLAGTAPVASRRPVVAVAAAALVVAVGVVVVLGLATRSDPDPGAPPTAESDGSPEALDPNVHSTGDTSGPFASTAEFLDALPVPETFSRLSPEGGSTFADAEYVVTSDFETTCDSLRQLLQAMDPAFPAPEVGLYAAGGVNRCEATGPMPSLGGIEVRALVRAIDNRVQIYVADATAPTSVSAP